jgi:predicted nucleic acid-binding protein
VKPVLIDSDILIEVARGRDLGLLGRWYELSESDVFIACSPITVAEVWHRARPQEHLLIEALFRVMKCIPIDAEMGRLAGTYLHRFAKSHRVELGDALIAATASIHDLALWTRNRKHYPMDNLTFF